MKKNQLFLIECEDDKGDNIQISLRNLLSGLSEFDQKVSGANHLDYIKIIDLDTNTSGSWRRGNKLEDIDTKYIDSWAEGIDKYWVFTAKHIKYLRKNKQVICSVSRFKWRWKKALLKKVGLAFDITSEKDIIFDLEKGITPETVDIWLYGYYYDEFEGARDHERVLFSISEKTIFNIPYGPGSNFHEAKKRLIRRINRKRRLIKRHLDHQPV